MKVIFNKNEFELKDANTFFNKLMGLMFKTRFEYCLRIKCNGIHTFFMRENIDVVLTDKNNNILYIYKSLKPNKIILPKKNVFYTYEFPADKIIFLDKNTIKIIN